MSSGVNNGVHGTCFATEPEPKIRTKTSEGKNPILQGTLDGIVGGVSTLLGWSARRRVDEVPYDSTKYGKLGYRGASYYNVQTNPFMCHPGGANRGDNIARIAFATTAAATMAGCVVGLSRVVGPGMTGYTIGLANLATHIGDDLVNGARTGAGSEEDTSPEAA